MVRKHPTAQARLDCEEVSNLGRDLESLVRVRFLKETGRADSIGLGIWVAQDSYSGR